MPASLKRKGMMADKPKTQDKGKGMFQAPTKAKEYKTGKRAWENKPEAAIRNAVTSQTGANVNAQGDLLEQQIQAQKDSNPYDGVQFAGRDDIAQVGPEVQGPQVQSRIQGPQAQDRVGVNDKAFGRGGYDDIVAQQYQNSLQNMAADQKQQSDDFEQMAAERGWTPGSAVYNQQRNRLDQQQAQAKQNALSSAQQLGMQGQQLGIQGESARVGANLASGNQQFDQQMRGAQFDAGQNDQQFQQQLGAANFDLDQQGRRFDQQRGRFADINTQAQNELGYNTGRRNLSASDAAVLQGMQNPQYAAQQAQGYEGYQAEQGRKSGQQIASTQAWGNYAGAAAQANAGVQIANINNTGMSNRQQYAQRTGMNYGGY